LDPTISRCGTFPFKSPWRGSGGFPATMDISVNN
jgi:hypothetical protein